MPTTRNQSTKSSSTSSSSMSSTISDHEPVGKDAHKLETSQISQPDSVTPHAADRSPSPPRLRERRSLITTKVLNSTLTTPTNNGTSISPPPTKRPLIAGTPTRILPKRSCGKSESLLAKIQPKPTHAANATPDTDLSHEFITKQQTATSIDTDNSDNNDGNDDSDASPGSNDILPTKKTNIVVSSRSASLEQHINSIRIAKQGMNNGQRAQSTTKTLTNSMTNQSLDTTSQQVSIISNKMAPFKNYSREIPPTRSTILASRPVPSPTSALITPLNGPTDLSLTKPVRITLPDTASGNTDVSVDPTKIDNSEGDKYMTHLNSTRKIGSIAVDPVETYISRSPTSSASSLTQRLSDTSLRVPNQNNRPMVAKNFNILIAITGSVATIKLGEIIKKLKSMFPRTFIGKNNNTRYRANITMKIVMTENSKHFVNKNELMQGMDGLDLEVFDDSDEWNQWSRIGDPVLHIELKKWADLCLIAPLDANTMAKIANGICDNLLTSTVRAWDTSKPLIYCPAMNVHMYNHPITRDHLCKLQSFGYLRVDCIEKRLACGDVGMGGMASVESISSKVLECLLKPVSVHTNLAKPLLNQQPTYPIISTSEASTNSNKYASMAHLLNRYRNNNQVAHHNQRSTLAMSNALLSNRSMSMPRNLKNNNGTDYSNMSLFVAEQNYDNGTVNIIPNGINSNKPIVTSIKNLRAIDSDCNEVPEEDFEESDLNNFDKEGLGYDLDPSSLLEQTLITEDSIETDHDSGSIQSNNGINQNLPFGSDGRQQLSKGHAPLLDTSKFLALCQDKKRNCFTCAICKNDYKNRKSMARHLKEQHVQGNIYRCSPCGVSYKRKEKLIKHNRERHGIVQQN